jgi:hypothetical protein
LIDLYEQGKAKFAWWQDWRNQYVAIVASGPTAKNAGVERLKDRLRVIAINENHKLAPFADVLYSCDAEWWKLQGGEAKKFTGIRLGFEVAMDGVHRINIRKQGVEYVHDLQFHEPGLLGSGGNSGFQCINLAAQFGAIGIGMIGFDMRLDQGMHWHGVHRSPMRNPDEERCRKWIKHIDAAADKLKFAGIDMVNCSEISRLEKYPKMTVEQMLQRWSL